VAKESALSSARAAAPPVSKSVTVIPDLDRLIHPRIRLGIISALDTTDGNLSVHARKLEEAKYIACVKSFDGRVPRTEYTLTPAGRTAFDRYLNHMEAILQAAKR
jgi:DNA-binding HxlR family transcriptional regulator